MLIRRKVCILTSVHLPFDPRIFYKEAKSLSKAGYDVSLVAQHDKEEIVDGIRIVPLPRPKNRFERMTKTVWQVYRKALKIDADIYHFHDPELMPIGLLLKLHGKKVIYDMHENVPKQIKNKDWINSLLRKYVAKFVSLAERLLLLDIPVIFAEISYRKDYLWANKYTTILNMPLINQLLPLEDEFPKSEKLLIGYIGGISEAQGSLITIEALKILKDRDIEVGFECIGLIEKFHEAQLLRLCKKYNLHNITFHGRVPVYDGWLIIARCRIGLVILHPIPNFLESYSTKMFEYMSAGIPVIASDFPLWRKIVEGAGCGLLVDPLDPKAIAKAMQWLLEHPKEAEIMGQRGRRAVESRYNWESEGKKLIAFYELLLSSKQEKFDNV